MKTIKQHLISKNGFSLFEMLIVLSILSVLLLLVIPSFQHQTKSMEMDYFLKELEQDLYYYQMKAITNGRTVRFIFSTNGSSYRVLEGITTIDEKHGPTGLKYIPRSLKLNELRFLPNGQIQKAGKIEITYGNKRYNLVFHIIRGRFYFVEV
ncbi:competence type IV pilus minor pilin ComGD [Salipaludibacillus daqingensis]|uniref:competence type IV pilus minor pilin ComGD n=1 Tax=Salipaludibacillus daqingensis TaxID=3041001 RepID=UPI002474B18A|nr:competence type IV pilus minor pilin ComGD [Salipaludibacillus daqingensis]